MKRFKKVYIEVTNCCNLDCKFCIKNSRKKEYMSIDNFKKVLNKLKDYTDYLYFHILGEPLLHPKFNELVEYGAKTFKINITTNGYLIDKINTENIRQLNISLHSFNEKYNVKLNEYLDRIFDKIDTLSNTYISLRLWVKSQYNNQIISYINKRYGTNISEKTNNYKINDHIFINNYHEFIWPDLNNNYYDEVGTCYGLIDHIGILVDGTIVPCCLDSRGIINLGNIYNDSISHILDSSRIKDMIKSFKKNKKVEELCKHCNFTSKQ